jgi:hypothetical protein
MSDLYIIHALDETTTFLTVFQEHFEKNYYSFQPDENVQNQVTELLESSLPGSLIVFLGHGHSTGLYSPESSEFPKEIFINAELGNRLFDGKQVILLSCNSSQFIDRLDTFQVIVGFGNILSSIEEVNTEAENVTGVYRKLSRADIDLFNKTYCEAIIQAIKLLGTEKYSFNDLPTIIEFQVNKRINDLLFNKGLSNRTEIAKLLFEFRDEMRLLAK